MCPDQFWINRTNIGVIFGPAGPLLVAKIGPAGPIFPPDQIFRDSSQVSWTVACLMFHTCIPAQYNCSAAPISKSFHSIKRKCNYLQFHVVSDIII